MNLPPFFSKLATLLTLCCAICVALPTYANKDRKGKKKKIITTVYDIQIEPDILVAKPKKATVLLSAVEARNPNSFMTGGIKEGIDVSRYQGTIDWEAVATEKISYAYIKATEGETLVDPQYRRNITQARRAGLKVGSYHFYRAHLNFDLQLQNLTSTIRPEEQDLLPIIDIEHKNGVPTDKFVRDLRRFIQAVTKYYGKKPVLYTFQNFYNRYLSGEFKDYVWMIAKYKDEEPILNDDLPYTMWQYTQTGSIRGIRGDVDRSMIMDSFSIHDFMF